MSTHDTLKRYGFTFSINVEARHSISDTLPNKKRCGVYVLVFNDATLYVGQAIDVCRRFLQHRVKNDDIKQIYFKNVCRCELDNQEKYFISALESEHILRNINYASFPDVLSSDLNLLIGEGIQNKWLFDLSSPIKNNQRVKDGRLRVKTAKRAEKLLNDKLFRNDSLPTMQRYVRLCLIEPFLTELTYWGCSCLNSNNVDYKLFSRINLRFQEVFTTGFDLITQKPFFSWHVSKSSLGSAHKLYSKKSIEISNHYYETGGKDQINIIANSCDAAAFLLQDADFLLAAKAFNLNCMRKGAQPYAKTHCLMLADYLLPSTS